jgi:hypothetical protein
MRRHYLLVVFIFSFLVSFAQQKKFSFSGAVEAGLLEGEQGSAFQLGAMAGIRKNTWAFSLGSGLDYYSVRSIPVYLDVQKNIFNKAKTPFVYVSGGYHFLWLAETFDDWSWRHDWEKKGGFYYKAGIGYQLPALKNSSLYFSAGYSEKEHSENYTSTFPCLIGPCPEYKETISNRLRRLSITTGLRF